ncbi:DUF2784 domain-containing protein [Methylibium rhizosphaerae]|uniref:DUF2784 domain-containing protein n=1 Tax=Methylibium rhizosphaerae TaxID=2570323 RepID=UPI001128BF99|nr:DUF2784 domain-containing protein [Methylibium rhizosphaerae]
MPYALFADTVLLLHLAFIAFAVLGGLLVLRWRRAAWLHLPALAWGAFIEFSGGICPLTPLENALRAAAGRAVYSQGFVERYIVPLIYPGELTRELQYLLGGALVGINLAIYGLVLYRRRRRR